MSNYFPPKSKRRRIAFLTLIAGVGVCLSLVGYWALRAKETRLLGMRLEADAAQRARAIESRFRLDLTAIWGLSSFVRRGQPGSRNEFREVADRVQNGNHDIHAVYWIPDIEADERELYEQAAQSEGLTAYETQELDRNHRLCPAFPLATGDLLPIYFAEPMDTQSVVLGLDLRSVAHLKEVINEAVSTGRPSVSTAVAWADDPQGPKVFVQLRAVYTDLIVGDGPDVMKLRRQKLLGFLAVLIHCDDMLAEALNHFGPGIDVRMLDTSAAENGQCMCVYHSTSNSTEFAPLADAPPTPVKNQPPAVPLDVPGHPWSIECQPTADYLAEQFGLLPIFSLGFGLLLTAVLTTYANTLLGRNERVQQLVDCRTAELDNERFLLETLLRYSPDYIYFKDRDSRFLQISHALASYCGLDDPAAAVGKSDGDFFDAARAAQYLADEQQIMTTGHRRQGRKGGLAGRTRRLLVDDQGALAESARRDRRHVWHLARHHRAQASGRRGRVRAVSAAQFDGQRSGQHLLQGSGRPLLADQPGQGRPLRVSRPGGCHRQVGRGRVPRSPCAAGPSG
jgi:CHASE1-domain containing sensor protein